MNKVPLVRAPKLPKLNPVYFKYYFYNIRCLWLTSNIGSSCDISCIDSVTKTRYLPKIDSVYICLVYKCNSQHAFQVSFIFINVLSNHFFNLYTSRTILYNNKLKAYQAVRLRNSMIKWNFKRNRSENLATSATNLRL